MKPCLNGHHSKLAMCSQWTCHRWYHDSSLFYKASSWKSIVMIGPLFCTYASETSIFHRLGAFTSIIPKYARRKLKSSISCTNVFNHGSSAHQNRVGVDVHLIVVSFCCGEQIHVVGVAADDIVLHCAVLAIEKPVAMPLKWINSWWRWVHPGNFSRYLQTKNQLETPRNKRYSAARKLLLKYVQCHC